MTNDTGLAVYLLNAYAIMGDAKNCELRNFINRKGKVINEILSAVSVRLP